MPTQLRHCLGGQAAGSWTCPHTLTISTFKYIQHHSTPKNKKHRWHKLHPTDHQGTRKESSLECLGEAVWAPMHRRSQDSRAKHPGRPREARRQEKDPRRDETTVDAQGGRRNRLSKKDAFRKQREVCFFKQKSGEGIQLISWWTAYRDRQRMWVDMSGK